MAPALKEHKHKAQEEEKQLCWKINHDLEDICVGGQRVVWRGERKLVSGESCCFGTSWNIFDWQLISGEPGMSQCHDKSRGIDQGPRVHSALSSYQMSAGTRARFQLLNILSHFRFLSELFSYPFLHDTAALHKAVELARGPCKMWDYWVIEKGRRVQSVFWALMFTATAELGAETCAAFLCWTEVRGYSTGPRRQSTLKHRCVQYLSLGKFYSTHLQTSNVKAKHFAIEPWIHD